MNQTQREHTKVGEDNTSVALSPRVLLQRLRIEALLKRHGLGMHVHQNTIGLTAPHHVAIITVSETAEGATHVLVEAVAGEVILHDGLAEFVRARNERIQPIQIEIAEGGTVRVVWRDCFPGDVEPARVVEALKTVAAEMDSLRTAATEDFLPPPPERASVSESTTREAA
jgi:hypothetical protein